MAMGGRSEEPIDALYETGPQSSTVFFEQTDASSPDIKSGPVLPPSNWVQKVLGSAGLELICRAVVEHAGVYYREVIAEGYLSKLPPKVPSRAWRRRFFKLCVNLSTDTQEPPLTLEYYRTKGDTKSKGTIALDKSALVTVDFNPSELRHWGLLDNGRLIKLVTKDRVYPLMADTADDCQQWLRLLRDLMCLSEHESSKTTQRHLLNLGDSYDERFTGILLSQVYDNPRAQLYLRAAEVQLVCGRSGYKVASWPLNSILRVGHCKQFIWANIATAQSNPMLLCFKSDSQAAEFADCFQYNAALLTAGNQRIQSRITGPERFSTATETIVYSEADTNETLYAEADGTDSGSHSVVLDKTETGDPDPAAIYAEANAVGDLYSNIDDFKLSNDKFTPSSTAVLRPILPLPRQLTNPAVADPSFGHYGLSDGRTTNPAVGLDASATAEPETLSQLENDDIYIFRQPRNTLIHHGSGDPTAEVTVCKKDEDLYIFHTPRNIRLASGSRPRANYDEHAQSTSSVATAEEQEEVYGNWNPEIQALCLAADGMLSSSETDGPNTLHIRELTAFKREHQNDTADDNLYDMLPTRRFPSQQSHEAKISRTPPDEELYATMEHISERKHICGLESTVDLDRDQSKFTCDDVYDVPRIIFAFSAASRLPASCSTASLTSSSATGEGIPVEPSDESYEICSGLTEPSQVAIAADAPGLQGSMDTGSMHDDLKSSGYENWPVQQTHCGNEFTDAPLPSKSVDLGCTLEKSCSNASPPASVGGPGLHSAQDDSSNEGYAAMVDFCLHTIDSAFTGTEESRAGPSVYALSLPTLPMSEHCEGDDFTAPLAESHGYRAHSRDIKLAASVSRTTARPVPKPRPERSLGRNPSIEAPASSAAKDEALYETPIDDNSKVDMPGSDIVSHAVMQDGSAQEAEPHQCHSLDTSDEEPKKSDIDLRGITENSDQALLDTAVVTHQPFERVPRSLRPNDLYGLCELKDHNMSNNNVYGLLRCEDFSEASYGVPSQPADLVSYTSIGTGNEYNNAEDLYDTVRDVHWHVGSAEATAQCSHLERLYEVVDDQHPSAADH